MPLKLLSLALAFLLPIQAQIGKGPGTGGGAGNGTGNHTGAHDVLTRPRPKVVPIALIAAGVAGGMLLAKKLIKKRKR